MKEGQPVMIKECHKIPELVGKTAEVVVTNYVIKYPGENHHDNAKNKRDNSP